VATLRLDIWLFFASGLVFYLDYLTPLGWAVWLLYLPIVIATIWLAESKAPWIVAGMSTALTFIGTIVSPPGLDPLVAYTNRTIGILLLWSAASAVAFLKAHQRTQEALRISEERLRTALSAGLMKTWNIDLSTGAVTWGTQQDKILNAPVPEHPCTMDEFYELIHPEDVDRVRKAAASAEMTGQFSQEFRVVYADGTVRWNMGQGAIIRDGHGNPIRMVGVNYDTTARKESQVRLEQFAEEMERKVTERTAELLVSQERLRALATELNLTEQRARNRMANELHDHLQQLLVLGKLKLGQVRRSVEALPASVEIIKEVDQVLTDSLAYTRTLVTQLSPTVLREHGLAAALKWLVESMKRHDLTLTVHVPQEWDLKLPDDQAIPLFQSVRELLINVSKHAGTGEATVTLTQHDSELRIDVCDHGVGFDLVAHATSPTTHSDTSSKFGLLSIYERMKAIGGAFDLQSGPGKGTRAKLSLPLDCRVVRKA